MATDPDDGDSEDAGNEVTESSNDVSGEAASSEDAGSEATESSDASESEWRFSLSDLEDDETGDAGAGRDTTKSAAASGDAADDESEDGEGLSAGVAGTLDVGEELEAGDVDLENALFVLLGVVLALLFVAGFLNLWP